jgi:predicted transcriptional regulator
MREALTVSLPEKTKSLVERLARAEGLTTSEYVRRAIFRQIWQDAAAESQRLALPEARKRGIFTDEDVFRLIS